MRHGGSAARLPRSCRRGAPKNPVLLQGGTRRAQETKLLENNDSTSFLFFPPPARQTAEFLQAPLRSAFPSVTADCSVSEPLFVRSAPKVRRTRLIRDVIRARTEKLLEHKITYYFSFFKTEMVKCHPLRAVPSYKPVSAQRNFKHSLKLSPAQYRAKEDQYFRV